jgi:hypothetical protein
MHLDWLTALFKAIRPALPKSHHGWVILILEITFILWVGMESIQTLKEQYKNVFRGDQNYEHHQSDTPGRHTGP